MGRPSSVDRLVRLLALPAWVAEHPGASFDEAAAHFGVGARTIERDVYTLWVSGLPGGLPDALVDFDADDFESRRLRLTQPLGLDRPIRLSREEAVSLLLALRVLIGLLDADAEAASPLRRAEAAVSALLGYERPDSAPPPDAPGRPAPAEGDGAGPAADRVPAAAPAPAGGSGAVLAAVRRATARRERLRLVYVSATDERTERDVDPLGLVSDGSHLSLLAWCCTARGERTFRLDRIVSAEPAGRAADPHPRPSSAAAGRPDRIAHGETAVLHLEPGGRWLAEQIPCEEVVRLADGSLRVRVVGRDERWLVGLVLSAGRHLRGVEPRSLAAAAAARARGALERYANGGTSQGH
ncbi:MAG: helix-turn-helix transcriptional regulator [Actinomyces dentalis]